MIYHTGSFKTSIFYSIFTMGRGKGKAKKSSVIAPREDRSGEEEKLPVKRRGRPTKAHKEEETEKSNEKTDAKLENKRKKPSLETEESLDTLKDENSVGPETDGLELTKAVGFRHNGSRRKNKPRRAAEVGVNVCEVCSWLVLRS
ncbi:hypothetical protein L1987_04287 [Smallanthus sonchifolius]|uniref:Uncharacterized protein n=1 Tax=Smallanthus sonchifolius TaxID=185202 RepID=A0ACB9KD58_9ASTR|nr:hypothetical protein L1987_04287 [Smallanthus sonchifolius]